VISFDFITDEAFRSCLESDYAELEACLNAKAWKSAHVVAGSIIEAVLIDYLLFSDSKAKARADPLKMDLATAISTCQKEGAISGKTAHLCSAVKDYRNLIHPGRSIRLGETIDENSARVAHALVGMVVAEVSNKKKETYGSTAEQLIAKLESDPSARLMIRQLMEGMHQAELERLLLTAIPKRHAETSEDEKADHDALKALERCFHNAFGMANEQTKQKAAGQLISVIKKDSGNAVLRYESAFFRAEQLNYLSDSEARLVKRHILRRPHVDESEASFRLIQDLEEFVAAEEAGEFVTAITYFATLPPHEGLGNKAAAYLAKPPSKMPHASKVAGARKMGELITLLREQKLEADAQKLEEYKKTWDTALQLEALNEAIKKPGPPKLKERGAGGN
jgi:hypothetical protein